MEPTIKTENAGEELPKKSWAIWLRDLINGKVLTGAFIIKQSKLLTLIFVLIICFISNRYACSKKLSEMDNLKQKLNKQYAEQVDLTKQLTSISRQSQIEELLQEKGIDLTKGRSTVYQIQK